MLVHKVEIGQVIGIIPPHMLGYGLSSQHAVSVRKAAEALDDAVVAIMVEKRECVEDLDAILSVRIVDGPQGALEHIARYDASANPR